VAPPRHDRRLPLDERVCPPPPAASRPPFAPADRPTRDSFCPALPYHLLFMLLWRGFGFRWRFTSHRLPLFSSWIDDATPPRHQCSLRIGAFPSDTADVTAHALRLDSPDVRLVHRGRTDLTVGVHLGWPAYAHARLPLGPLLASTADPTPSPLPPSHTLVPVLDGFSLRALDSDAGWHFGGLGLAVAVEDEQLVVTARIRPAESPHPWIFGLGDWSWEDDAVHDVTVGWALLAVPRDLVRPFVSDGRASSTTSFAQTSWPAPPPTTEPSSPGPAAAASPAVLLQGFDFAVDAPPTLRRRSGYLRNLNGRYLLELAAGVARRDGADAPDVRIGNQVHWIIRLGSVLGLLLLFVGAVVALFEPVTLIAGIVLLVFLAGSTVAWPTMWFDAPAVPFSVGTRLECVAFDVPSEAVSIHHVHAPDGDDGHTSWGTADESGA